MASLGFIGAGTLLWQSNIAEAEEAQSPPEETKEQEVLAESKAEDEIDEDALVGGVFRMLTAKNVETILKDEQKSRFVYFYRGDEKEIGPVAAFAEKMTKGMGTEAIILDCENNGGADKDAVLEYLKKRNPKTVDKVTEQFDTNQFLLLNKYDDIWFWQRELMQNLYGTVAD